MKLHKRRNSQSSRHIRFQYFALIEITQTAKFSELELYKPNTSLLMKYHKRRNVLLSMYLALITVSAKYRITLLRERLRNFHWSTYRFQICLAM